MSQRYRTLLTSCAENDDSIEMNVRNKLIKLIGGLIVIGKAKFRAFTLSQPKIVALRMPK